jgi:putative methionine-R-sulfoxide reductase with GAF domain
MLYLPLVKTLGQYDPSEFSDSAYYFIVGLSGAVLIFCLFVALKQRELEKMRETLVREAQETEQIRTRLLELSAMFQLSTTLNLQLRLPVVLEIIVRRVVSALRAQQASIMLYNIESGHLETRAAYGLESEFTRDARVPMGGEIAGRVAESGEGMLLNGASDDPELARHYKTDRNITSALSLPLRVGERCIGVLNVNRINHPETFEDHHREILAMFSEHVASVIEPRRGARAHGEPLARARGSQRPPDAAERDEGRVPLDREPRAQDAAHLGDRVRGAARRPERATVARAAWRVPAPAAHGGRASDGADRGHPRSHAARERQADDPCACAAAERRRARGRRDRGHARDEARHSRARDLPGRSARAADRRGQDPPGRDEPARERGEVLAPRAARSSCARRASRSACAST